MFSFGNIKRGTSGGLVAGRTTGAFRKAGIVPPGTNQQVLGAASLGISGINSMGLDDSMGGASWGMGSNTSDRWMPVFDNPLDKTPLEEWIPQDDWGMLRLYRKIYVRDEIAGPSTDLMSLMPFSDWNLTGDIPADIMQNYQDSLDALDLRVMMPEIGVEYLSLGRVVSSLIWDNTKGIWSDLFSFPPEMCIVQPRFIRGFEPKINIRISPEILNWANSRDPRDIDAQKELPEEFLKLIQRGGTLPLNPLSTLYLPRKTFTTDWIGTSWYSRLLPFFVLEQILMGGTLVTAVRRQRSILHIKAGSESWEPDAEEREMISNLFQMADEDPIGAIVVTNPDVQADEVRSGTEGWKVSDSWDWLTNAKLKSLGVGDSFLSADASYSSMQVTLQVFVENVLNFRNIMTHRIFDTKLFPMQARVHGYIKRSGAEMRNNIRIKPSEKDNPSSDAAQDQRLKEASKTAKNDEERKAISHLRDQIMAQREERDRQLPSYRESMAYKDKELWFPTLNWTKQLNSVADQDYMSTLQALKEAGVPPTVRMWAMAGGVDAEDYLRSLQQDVKDREILDNYNKKLPKASEGEEGGGQAWGSTQETPPKSMSNQQVHNFFKQLLAKSQKLPDKGRPGGIL